MKSSTSLVLSLAYCLVGISLQSLPTSAQITPDGTTSTTVNVNENNFEINNGDRIGDNLFHSFDGFSVPTLGSAAFNNASDIANIFSRVTGNNISDIDGLISANGTANLFLINPNGIIFGENASLNLGGSFLASTADSLLFEDNLEFSASNPQAPPLLKVNMPIGLNLGKNPEEIVNRSFVQNSAGDFVGLEVTPGENLTLVGGNINFEGGEATARGGNIELGGLSEAGTVGISEDGSLNFPEDVAKADITLSNAADVDVTGTGGGSIIINAGNLNLEAGDFGSSFISAGITADSTSIDAQAGDIVINADAVSLTNSSIRNATEGSGKGGEIKIKAGSLSLTDGAQVGVGTFGSGQGGNLIVNASESVQVIGRTTDGRFGSGLFTQVPGGAGNGGDLRITTGELLIQEGAQVNSITFGSGSGGNLIVNASKSVQVIGKSADEQIGSKLVAQTVGTGAGGDLTINTPMLLVRDEAQVGANSFGSGPGGNLIVNASKSVQVIGSSANGQRVSGLATQNQRIGKAGDLTINTPMLLVRDGAQVGSGTFRGSEGAGGNLIVNASKSVQVIGTSANGQRSSGLFTQTEGKGEAGDMTISTPVLLVQDGAKVSASTLGQGNAGDVTVNARESITISGATDFFRSGISADAFISSGNGGDVNVFTNQLTIDDGGTIEAGNFDNLGVFEPGTGKPGNINIQANSLSLSNQASIEAATQSEIGEGANINLTIAEDIILRNNSLVSARALQNADGGNVTINASDGFIIAFPNQNNDIIANAEQGNGGRINISTQAIFGLEERRSTPPNQTNDIDASSEFGLQGEITINTPETDPTKGLIELPESINDPSDQISQNPCERGVSSKFISTGRGGLPPSPTETLSSREVWKDVQLPTQFTKNSANTIKHSNTNPERIVEATAWIINEEGILELIAEESSDTRQGSCR